MKIKMPGKYVTWIEDDDGIEVPVTNDIVTGLMNLGAQAQIALGAPREEDTDDPYGQTLLHWRDIDPIQVLRDAANKETV